MRSRLVATVFLLSCCAAFVSLGVWQLSRAEEKRLIEDGLRTSLIAATQEWHQHSQAFTRVRVRGRFDPEQVFFIDNRIHLGEPGVQVVQAFDTHAGARLLVDRGWMPHPDRRVAIKSPATPTAQVEIVGLLLPDFGTGPQFDDGERDMADHQWSRRLQQLSLKRMRILANVQHEHLLRMRVGEPGALTVMPFELPVSADRHLGYAVQWFGLALASIIILMGLARKYSCKKAGRDG